MDNLSDLIEYRAGLKGDEKGEAQVFLDRLFIAYGHGGVSQAGATLEERVKNRGKGTTTFADLVWKPRVLIEMKKAGTDPSTAYQQMFNYWVNLVPNRPKYSVSCNFDEFWIYELDKQVYDPVDKVPLADLPKRWEALSFLLPEQAPPVFQQDMVSVTAQAASRVAELFRALVARGVDRLHAQRFVLQSVLAMFSEDIGLLPSHMFTTSVRACIDGDSAYVRLFSLFDEMNTPGKTAGGPFKGTPYFNGGVFKSIHKIDLTASELELLHETAVFDWSAVRPAIFGAIFEASADQSTRHAYGQHFTDEADIMRVIGPTITKPWLARIEAAKTLKDLGKLEQELMEFRVLDPACGCGNFLYLAYRELRRVEKALRDRRYVLSTSKKLSASQVAIEFVTPDNFYGLDVDPFAIEIAKTTLMLAKKLAADDVGDQREVLPLDDLSSNFHVGDALDPAFHWPDADVCIGNPPYLGRMKMQEEHGARYLQTLDGWYPEVKGKANYVVYWFQRAHDLLPVGGRAGFVATDSVREGATRQASLDYILDRGATITEAVSSQPWTGAAQVDVSIVNWVKGEQSGPHTLVLPDGSKVEISQIGASLSNALDTATAQPLRANTKPKRCFQGQTPGHKGFVVDDPVIAHSLMASDSSSGVVLPFFTGKELNASGVPERWVIDFAHGTKVEARKAAPGAFDHLAQSVMPDRQDKAKKEQDQNNGILADDADASVNWHHRNFFDTWWQQAYRRGDMLARLNKLSRYIGLSRYAIAGRMSIFAFIDPNIRPMDKMMVFGFDDDYSLGVLQSSLHRRWFEGRATFGASVSYTATSFTTFPWPQNPTGEQVNSIVAAVKEILGYRDQMLSKGISFGEMYDSLRLAGPDPLHALHATLDAAVVAAYGFGEDGDPLEHLLSLNAELATAEKTGGSIRGPGPDGLPGVATVTDTKIVADAVKDLPC